MGIPEKKAIRALAETMEGGVIAAMREATGNSALQVDWQFADSMTAPEIGIAAANVSQEFPAVLAAVCQDEDYREELGKVATIRFVAQTGLEKNRDHWVYASMTLAEDVLEVGVDGAYALGGGSDGAHNYLKSLF